MRDLRFRGYHKEKGIMVYAGEYRSGGYDWELAEENDVEMVNLCLNNDEYEWMQFTGLYDKNGRNIYEGDIVSRDEDSPDLEVVFEDGCFIIKEMVPTQQTWYLHTEADMVEVIDNIFESDEGE